LCLASTLVLALWLASAAAAVTITEFPLGAGSLPRYIHPGPDGNLWFTEVGPSPGIGRISPAGEFFTPISDTNGPVDLVVLPNQTVMWVGDKGIGWRRPDGTVETLDRSLATPFYAIALIPDGTPRFTQSTSGGYAVCGLITPNMLGTDCHSNVPSTRLTGLALGSDGRLWAAAPEANVIYRLDANGDFADNEIDLPAGSVPVRLALASDGNLWATMHDASAVDRLTPSGTRTRFPLPPAVGPTTSQSVPTARSGSPSTTRTASTAWRSTAR
jgi:streptogramin lyase